MKDQLIALGWVMYYECVTPCAKQYYSNPSFAGYEVRVRTKYNTFSIVLNNQVIGGSYLYTQLKEKLKQFGIYEN